MKTKVITAFAVIVVMVFGAIFALQPVTSNSAARFPVYRVRGTFDTWYLVDGEPVYSSKIVESEWTATIIMNSRCRFGAKWIELNIDKPEEDPGTYDFLESRMQTDDISDNPYVLEGLLHFYKNGAYYFSLEATIEIDETSYLTQIVVNLHGSLEGWKITGSITP